MIKSKFAKIIVLGLSITVLSSGVAFADTGGGQSAVAQPAGDRGIYEKEIIVTTDTRGVPDVSAPDSAVSRPAPGSSAINEEVLKKQSEIDLYLFKQHSEEIAQQGIKITYTSPLENYVEIGILPYNEVNADYLYNVLGKDMVKVVEGVQVDLIATTAIAPDTSISSPALGSSGIVEDSPVNKRLEAGIDSTAELYAASDAVGDTRETVQTGSSMPVVLASAAGAVMLGGALIAARRRSAAGR
jgi:hypothetical protein